MNFNYSELVQLEWETGRVLRAVSQFADTPTKEVIDKAMFIVAEVRNAGHFLCDPNTCQEVRQQVVDRLCELFRSES